MNSQIKLPKRAVKLKDEFLSVTGSHASHFFCPILYRDEEVELCKAHVVNQAIPGAPKEWVPQRKDTDNFFGSHFEAEFVKLVQYRQLSKPTLERVLADPKLAKRYRPTISLKGNPLGSFMATGPIPPKFTGVSFEFPQNEVKLGLKIKADELLRHEPDDLEISVELDARLPALVSLIKAAHLTMFYLLGYRYALSAGGYFVGHTILGDFFSKTRGHSKPCIREMAINHFAEFANMVRPVHNDKLGLKGTASDGRILFCKDGRTAPWGMIIFVNTGVSLHAVLLPIFEAPGLIARYLEFLSDKTEYIEVQFCEYRDETWHVVPRSVKQRWPRVDANFL